MCTSPGRQTTIEKDPGELYKTMVESKEAHIKQLTQQLEEKVMRKCPKNDSKYSLGKKS